MSSSKAKGLIVYYSIPHQKVIVDVAKITAKQSYSFDTESLMSNEMPVQKGWLVALRQSELCLREGKCKTFQTYVVLREVVVGNAV